MKEEKKVKSSQQVKEIFDKVTYPDQFRKHLQSYYKCANSEKEDYHCMCFEFCHCKGVRCINYCYHFLQHHKKRFKANGEPCLQRSYSYKLPVEVCDPVLFMTANTVLYLYHHINFCNREYLKEFQDLIDEESGGLMIYILNCLLKCNSAEERKIFLGKLIKQ